MYPFYWTTSERGLFMRYNYEFKRNAVELYRQGKWPDTPDGVTTQAFQKTVRQWARIEEACGPEALKHKGHNKEWTAEERCELVARVIAGESIRSVAYSVGIDHAQLRHWVHKYKILGYNGLVDCKKGRPARKLDMKKINYNNPRKLEESEYEELVRLRAENEYIKAEIEVIKKEIALREEKEAARLKAKKQQSSRNSEKTDSN